MGRINIGDTKHPGSRIAEHRPDERYLSKLKVETKSLGKYQSISYSLTLAWSKWTCSNCDGSTPEHRP